MTRLTQGKAGQGRPQGKDRAGHCHSPGKNGAGRRARTGQVTHWAATGQAAGQGQGRPQGKDRAGHRARTRLVAGQGQDRPQCHWHGATGQVGHDRPHGKDRAGCRAGRLQGKNRAGHWQCRRRSRSDKHSKQLGNSPARQRAWPLVLTLEQTSQLDVQCLSQLPVL